MTKFPIYAVTITALAAPTAAYPTDFRNWECPGDVQVSVTFTAPWKTVRHYYHHDISIDGLRDLVKDHVTFRKDTKRGVFRAYLNGKPCRDLEEEKPKPPPLTADASGRSLSILQSQFFRHRNMTTAGA
jgi:hypothetical protein